MSRSKSQKQGKKKKPKNKTYNYEQEPELEPEPEESYWCQECWHRLWNLMLQFIEFITCHMPRRVKLPNYPEIEISDNEDEVKKILNTKMKTKNMNLKQNKQSESNYSSVNDTNTKKQKVFVEPIHKNLKKPDSLPDLTEEEIQVEEIPKNKSKDKISNEEVSSAGNVGNTAGNQETSKDSTNYTLKLTISQKKNSKNIVHPGEVLLSPTKTKEDKSNLKQYELKPNLQKMPGGKQTIPEGKQITPGGKETIPEGKQIMLGGKQTIPKEKQLMPGGKQTIPEGKQITPGGKQTILKEKQIMPGEKQIMLRGKQIMPNAASATEHSKDTTQPKISDFIFQTTTQHSSFMSNESLAKSEKINISKVKTNEEFKVSPLIGPDWSHFQSGIAQHKPKSLKRPAWKEHDKERSNELAAQERIEVHKDDEFSSPVLAIENREPVRQEFKKKENNDNTAQEIWQHDHQLDDIEDFLNSVKDAPTPQNATIPLRSTYKSENIHQAEKTILVLGQSGVGKSTWINSLINYIQYQDMDDAEDGDILSPIETTFTVTDSDYETKVVTSSGKVIEESDIGASKTKICSAYSFKFQGTLINIIDTPGLGDTDGIERDRAIVEDIFAQLSNIKTLHGICILLKPNESKLHALFRFCLTELLCRLHTSAKHVLSFVFTNSRSTFYRPGDTLAVLSRVLDENKIDIQFSSGLLFCVDNEAFRYLCSRTVPDISYTRTDRLSFKSSWDRSSAETKRFLTKICNQPPHQVKDTLILNKSLNMLSILLLTIGNLLKSIDSQISYIEDDLFAQNSELQFILYCITCRHRHDGYPTCDKLSYERKYLTPSVPNIQIKYCDIMNEQHMCRRCGCSWDLHRIVLPNHAATNTLQREVNSSNEIIQQMLTLGARLVHFIKLNSLSARSDCLKNYLLDLLKHEDGGFNIQNVYDSYCSLADECDGSEIFTLEDLEKKFMELPGCGKLFEKLLNDCLEF